jgi:UDP-glucose 4-epimerase
MITGIAGGLAQLVGKRLHELGYEIIGVDYRREIELPFATAVYAANYNKTKIEDIVRRHRPTHVLHLGRVGNLKIQLGKRFDLNVIGSRKVMDLAARYGAKRVIVLSTFHIYGAHPHNHIPIYEEEPLRAGLSFPQIADAIQLDNQALMWIYQHPECRGVLLRPCNVIGPDISNATSRYLRSNPVISMLGFDPMVQFIHQQDLVEALVRANEGHAVGVFNVAGKGSLPLSAALKATGARRVMVPDILAKGVLSLARMIGPALPPYLVNFSKYPCIISDQKLRETFDWEPRIDQLAAVHSTVRDPARLSGAVGR